MADYLARVNPRYFAAVHHCAAKKDVRHYLEAVQIERHHDAGVILVATNGHVLAAMHDEKGWLHPDHNSILVARTTSRLTSALIKNRGCDGLPPAYLWVGADCLVVTSAPEASDGDDVPTDSPDPFGQFSHIAERSRLLEANYPDWRRPLPPEASDESSTPWANSMYLALFNEVAKALGSTSMAPGGGMQLHYTGANRTITIRLGDPELQERFLGLIMPRCGEPLKSKFPRFLQPFKAQEGLV